MARPLGRPPTHCRLRSTDGGEWSSVETAQAFLEDAILDRGALEVRFGFDRPPRLRDFLAIEKAINGWLRDTLRDHGFPISKRQRLIWIDPAASLPVEDGKNDVFLVLDFGVILPAMFGMSVGHFEAAVAASQSGEEEGRP